MFFPYPVRLFAISPSCSISRAHPDGAPARASGTHTKRKLGSAIGPLLLAICVRRYASSTPLLFSLAPLIAILGFACLIVRLPNVRPAASVDSPA